MVDEQIGKRRQEVKGGLPAWAPQGASRCLQYTQYLQRLRIRRVSHSSRETGDENMVFLDICYSSKMGSIRIWNWKRVFLFEQRWIMFATHASLSRIVPLSWWCAKTFMVVLVDVLLILNILHCFGRVTRGIVCRQFPRCWTTVQCCIDFRPRKFSVRIIPLTRTSLYVTTL